MFYVLAHGDPVGFFWHVDVCLFPILVHDNKSVSLLCNDISNTVHA